MRTALLTRPGSPAQLVELPFDVDDKTGVVQIHGARPDLACGLPHQPVETYVFRTVIFDARGAIPVFEHVEQIHVNASQIRTIGEIDDRVVRV